jgi:hypothetical protein
MNPFFWHERYDAVDCLLQHIFAGGNREKLFGAAFGRKRPEPFAFAAGHNYGVIHR